MKKIVRVATIPSSLQIILKGQLKYLSNYYEVIAISSEEEGLKEIERHELVRTKAIKMKRNISIIKDIISILNLTRYLLKEQPYIVHAHTTKAGFISMIAASIARVPNRIYTVTGLRFETLKGIKRKIVMITEKISCLLATKVIPEGAGVRNTLKKYNITNKELNVIGNGNINGIDSEYYKLTDEVCNKAKRINEELKFIGNEIVFCFVGRIVRDKGVEDLLSAFVRVNKEFANCRLIVIGPFEDELDPISEESKNILRTHPAISFFGFIKDIRPFLALSTVFVFPSYREGFPNVILQAGCFNLPCIVTDINGSNEIIVNGKNGLIIEPGNIGQLKEAMKKIIINVDLRKELSSNSRKMIITRFEQKYVWSELLKEYQELEKIDNSALDEKYTTFKILRKNCSPNIL